MYRTKQSDSQRPRRRIVAESTPQRARELAPPARIECVLYRVGSNPAKPQRRFIMSLTMFRVTYLPFERANSGLSEGRSAVASRYWWMAREGQCSAPTPASKIRSVTWRR